MSANIFVIYEMDTRFERVEILGYASNEDEAERICDDWEEYEKSKGNYRFKYSYQELVFGEINSGGDCLDGIRPTEWGLERRDL